MRLEPALLAGGVTKVVANLPYSIASPLLVDFLEAGIGSRYVVTIQEEVAQRLVAKPGTRAYGLLTVAVRAHAVPAIVARVPRAAFFPPPKVTSAIVRLDVPDLPPVPRPLVPAVMAIARAAFGQRRKMLRSSLRPALGQGADAAAVEALCRHAGIDPRRRGESLSLEEFEGLARRLTVEADREDRAPSGNFPVGV
jgi:16S rRNA (adenine1518-N6/adenine1519-N6)-dimethyltransferase